MQQRKEITSIFGTPWEVLRRRRHRILYRHPWGVALENFVAVMVVVIVEVRTIPPVVAVFIVEVRTVSVVVPPPATTVVTAPLVAVFLYLVMDRSLFLQHMLHRNI